MIDLNEITVFNDIRERLAAVTDTQIEAIARKLKIEKMDNKKVKRIGRVESKATRALYALSRLLQAEHQLEHAKSDCAEEPDIAKDHEEKAVLLDMMADVARELFWAQAKIDLGFYKEENTGIRGDWEIVQVETPNPAMMLRGMMGGPADLEE